MCTLLRPAEPEDENAVVDLWTACGLVVPWNDPHADFRLARGRAGSDVVVAEAKGTILAAAMIGHDGHRGWIYYLGTRPEARSRGLAKRLIAHAESWAKARGIPKMQLLVRNSNVRVRGFYESLGYAVNPTFVMQKVL